MHAFHAEACPLEMYHYPTWIKAIIRVSAPALRSRFSAEALEPLATGRAAALQTLAGVHTGLDGMISPDEAKS